MNIFPHILCRIGGGSINEFSESLCFPALQDITTKLVRLHKEKEKAKSAFSERLRKFIEKEHDAKKQNLLQNFRRDIYNERNIKDEIFREVEQVISAGLNKEWRHYLSILNEHKNLMNETEEVYEQETMNGRNNLKSLLLKDNLQNGLLLSSNTLLGQIPKYVNKPVGRFTKKEVKMEYSILQYLTRIYTKTSPFSSFTNLAIGKLKCLPDEVIKITPKVGNKGVITSHVRLNNYLFKYLKILLIQYRPVYLRLFIRPNPTIENKGDYFLYLTNNHNLESFQRISANPFLSLLLTLCKENKEGKKFIALIDDAVDHVNASRIEVEKYIKQLLKYGFLEYDFQVSGLDPDWDVKMTATLAPIGKDNIPLMEELIQTLIHIRELMQQYQVATANARKEILAEAYTNFRSTCFKIHEAAGLPAEERIINKEGSHSKKTKEKFDNSGAEKEKSSAFSHENNTAFYFKQEQLFYEDTTREITVNLDKDALQKFMQELNDLLKELGLFKGSVDEKLKMQDYFLGKYGMPGKINVLEFYQDFYQDVKKPELVLDEKRKKANHELEDKTEIVKEETPQKKDKDWHQQLILKNSPLSIDPDETILLNKESFDHHNFAKHIGIGKSTQSNSFGAFIQFYKEKDTKGNYKLKGVLNSSFPGYGKMMSRFLHIFDEKITSDIRSWNLKLSEGKMLLENCDASYFNANIHPCLMPYEIRMPSSNNLHSTDEQLSVGDFELCIRKESQGLKLFHKPSGKECHVLDLGFQSIRGRSKLFQLLDQFTKSEYLHVYPIVNAVNNSLDDSSHKEDRREKVKVLPRIVYEDQIILQRKSWLIPKALLLKRKHGETNSGFYFRMNIWRKGLGIPDETFVFITPVPGNRDTQQEKNQKIGKDDYKPQYINFNSPLLVNLLEKLIKKAPYTLKVQEMLPTSNQMLHIEGQYFVSECMVQWYNFK